MTPTYTKIYETGIKPYNENAISQESMLNISMGHIKNYMLEFTRPKDLKLFLEFSKERNPELKPQDMPIFVIIPAFIISELKTAFQIAFLLFIPFVVVDLIVSNILLSLGMFMLSPVMVSLPFKILLFVLADGWHLITQGLLIGTQIQ